MEGFLSCRSDLQVLPTELLLEIFGLVDKADLKSLRLVSRRFNGIAPSILFMSVNASPHAEDLEVLRLISEHQAFRHYVREIVYFEVYFHPRGLSEPPDDGSPADPTLQPDVHVSIIAAALAKMPKLRDLILKNHWLPPRDDPGYIYSDEEMDDVAVYGPRTSRHFPTTAGVPYGIPVERYAHGRPVDFDYGFGIMCHALAISDVRLRSFSVDYVREYDLYDERDHLFPGGLHLATFSSMSLRDLKYACNAFRNFRQISLGLSWDFLFICSKRTHRGVKGNLPKILAAAQDLEELKLDFGDKRQELPLKYVLGTNTWPRLRSLYLRSNHVDEKDLADLLYRHRETLKSLHLWWICLKNGDWWTWAESLQPWISSSLEQIEFTPRWCEKREKIITRRGTVWMKSECCLKNYLLLGHYKRDCCHTSRFISKHLTDEEVMRTLRGRKKKWPCYYYY
jgi:F-box-like